MSFKTIINMAYSMPKFFYSIVVFAIILMLTLMPIEGSQSHWHLFPNADKVVHFLMFGGLSAVFMFDCWREGLRINGLLIFCTIFLSSDLGGVVELLQDLMGLGRSGDFYDFLADSAGAFVFAFISGYLCTRCLKK